MPRLTLTLLCVFAFSSSASAETVLYDSNGFESPTFTAGSTPIGQDPSNPWTFFGGSPAAFEVQTTKVASGLQAVQGNGGGLNSGAYVYPQLHFEFAPGEKLRVQADIARTISTNPANSNNTVYAIEIFDFDFNRTSRIGLLYRNDATLNTNGIKAFINVPDPGGPVGTKPQLYGDPVPAGTFVNFDVVLDYTAKTVSLSLNHEVVDAAVPFNEPTSNTFDSAELQVGTLNNVSNDNGWFDNYVVSVINLRGDYNLNGVVDGADYVVWRDTLNSAVPAGTGADGNSDGTIDAADFDIWRARFGMLTGSGSGVGLSAAVPEPSSIATLLLSLVAVAGGSRRARAN